MLEQVANLDFQLCRSRKEGHKVRRKVESSSSEAKIIQIGAGEENFSKLTEKGDKWTMLLCVGRENRAADSRCRAFETTLASLDFVYRKL